MGSEQFNAVSRAYLEFAKAQVDHSALLLKLIDLAVELRKKDVSIPLSPQIADLAEKIVEDYIEHNRKIRLLHEALNIYIKYAFDLAFAFGLKEADREDLLRDFPESEIALLVAEMELTL